MMKTEHEAYLAERFEYYRAQGEDYGTAWEWALEDAEAKFGA